MKRKSKYGNIRTEYNGRMYASKKEAQFARQLNLLKKAIDLQERVLFWIPQVSFRFRCGVTYYADFFVMYGDNTWKYFDVKSVPTKTQSYKIKKKLLLDEYNINIKEV